MRRSADWLWVVQFGGLELATALFLLKLFPFELPRLEIAKACQRAEHRYVGVQSGLLDQVISLFGRAQHAVFFDSRTDEIRTVPFPSSLALIIAESTRTRELASGKYNLRRTETQNAAHAFGVRALRDLKLTQMNERGDIPDLFARRARHVVGENERVWRAVELLEAGDGSGSGELMNESHESSRRNFENSTLELDLLVSIAHRLPESWCTSNRCGIWGGDRDVVREKRGARCRTPIGKGLHSPNQNETTGVCLRNCRRRVLISCHRENPCLADAYTACE